MNNQKAALVPLALDFELTTDFGEAGAHVAESIALVRLGAFRVKADAVVFKLQSEEARAVVHGNREGACHPAIATMLGCNYGANLSLFPALTKDLWGLKNFGMNYGVLFTAWGMGSLLSKLQQKLSSASGGSFKSSFLIAGLLLLVGAVLTRLISPSAASKPAE